MKRNPTIFVQSNPNNVLFGKPNDVFFRVGDDLFFVDGETQSTTKISTPIKLFLGKYNAPLYRKWPLVFTYPAETWIKKSASRSRVGWKFLYGAAPSAPDHTILVTPTSTPVPSATPVPTATSAPTATPTDTPIPTATPTDTPIPTATPTDTPVPTATPTDTPVPTPTPTDTDVPTATPTDTPVPTPTPTATDVPLLSQYFLNVDDNVGYLSSSIGLDNIKYSINASEPATASIQFIEIWEVSGSALVDNTGSKMWVESNTLLGTVDLVASGTINVDITSYMLSKSENTSSAVVFVSIGNVSSDQYSLMTNVTTSLNTLAVNDNVRVGDVFVSPHSPNEIGVTNSTNTTYIRGDFTNHAVSFPSSSLTNNQATFTLTGMYADPINLVLPFPNYTLDLAGATTFITGGIDSNGIGYSNFAGVASDMNMTFSDVLVNKATGSVVSPGVLDSSAGYTGVGSINFGSIVDSSSIDITQFLLNNPFSDPQVLAVSFTADYSGNTYELFVDLFLVTSSIATFEPFEVDNISTPYAGIPINIVDALGNTTQSVNYSKNAVKIVNRVGHGSGSFIVSSPYNIHPLVLPSYTPPLPPS